MDFRILLLVRVSIMPFHYFVQKLKDVSISSVMEYITQEKYNQIINSEFWGMKEDWLSMD